MVAWDAGGRPLGAGAPSRSAWDTATVAVVLKGEFALESHEVPGAAPTRPRMCGGAAGRRHRRDRICPRCSHDPRPGHREAAPSCRASVAGRGGENVNACPVTADPDPDPDPDPGFHHCPFGSVHLMDRRCCLRDVRSVDARLCRHCHVARGCPEAKLLLTPKGLRSPSPARCLRGTTVGIGRPTSVVTGRGDHARVRWNDPIPVHSGLSMRSADWTAEVQLPPISNRRWIPYAT